MPATINENKKDNSEHFEEKTEISSTDFYQNYLKILVNTNFDKNFQIEKIHQACFHLIVAAAMGNAEASSSLLSERKFLTHEFNYQIETEFSLRLQSLASANQRFLELKNHLFLLKYTAKYQSIYTDSMDRYTELYQGLEYLVQAKDKIDKSFISFLQKIGIGNITTSSLTNAAGKIFLSEILNKDVMLSTLEKPVASPQYPFRILSKQKFEELLGKFYSVQTEETVKLTQLYLETIKTVADYYKCELHNDTYAINITTEWLQTNKSKPICFVDKEGLEIVRLEFTSEKLYFKAYGDNIKISIQGKLDCPVIINENHNGNTTLNIELENENSIYIGSRSNKLTYNGNITSKQDIKFDTDASLEITTQSKLDAQKEIGIRGKALILRGQLNANTYIQTQIVNEIIIGHTSINHATLGFNITAGSLNDIRGYLITDKNILINAKDSIYLHGNATFNATENIIISAKSIMTTDKSVITAQQSLHFNINETTIAEKKSIWLAQTIALKTGVFKNYSPHISGETITIRIDNYFQNFPNSKITTSLMLQIKGDSFWNGGHLDFGNSLDIKINNFFVHGVAEVSVSQLRQAFTNAKITGENASIVAGVAFGALGGYVVRNKNIVALVVLGADATLSKYTKKSSILAIETSIDLPNLEVIFKDLTEFSKMLKMGEYKAISNSVLSWQTASNMFSVVRWVVRTLWVGGGKAVDLAASIIMLFATSPMIYKQCRDLYLKTGGKVERYDLYTLIASASNFAIQSYNLETQIESLLDTGIDFSFNSKFRDDIPALGLSFASLFAPGITNDSVIGISAFGLSANMALTKHNLLSYEFFQAELGLNVSHNFYTAIEDHKIVVGNNVSNIGNNLSRSGLEISNNDFVNVNEQNDAMNIATNNVVWNVKNLTENDKLTAKKVQIVATQNLNHKGDFDVSDAIFLKANELNTAEGSKLRTKTLVEFGNNINNNGDSETKETLIKASNNVNISKTSHNIAEKIAVEAKNITADGKFKIIHIDKVSEQAIKPASSAGQGEEKKDEAKPIDAQLILHAEEKVNIGKNSEIDAANSSVVVAAKDIDDSGAITSNELDLLSSGNLNITSEAKANVNRLLGTGDNIKQNGVINIQPSHNLANDTPTPSGSEEKKADDEKATPDVAFIAKHHMNFGEASQINGDQATLYAKGEDIDINGKTNVHSVTMQATNSLTTGVTEDTQAAEIIYDATNKIILAGNIHAVNSHEEQKPADDKAPLKPAILIHSKQVEITKDSREVAEGDAIANIADENLTDAGTAEAKIIIDQAKGHLKVTQDAHHQASELISEQGQTAELKGHESSKVISVNVEHGLDVNSLLQQKGDFSNFVPTETIVVETKDRFTLSENLNKNINVSLSAASIEFTNKEVHTKNLELKSSIGNVDFNNSKVSVDKNLVIDSAQSFKNDHSSALADVISIHTQCNITNYVGNLKASTYLQAIADHGNIRNEGELVKTVQNGVSRPVYHASVMQGGSGVGYDGIGAYLKADGKIVNIGSVITSLSSLYGEGRLGIDNLSVSYSYILPNGNHTSSLGSILHRIIHANLPPQLAHENQAGQITSPGHVYLNTDGDILNSKSQIHANETYLGSKHDIKNIAGLLQGDNYLQLLAGHNVENICIAYDVKGKYDTLKYYDIGHIIGGAGVGHDGNGLYAKAGYQIINDASEISSVGNNVLDGKYGIISQARYNEYISYYRHDKTWYGKETKTVDYSFQLQSALIYSATGSNIVVSEEGGIDSCSTDFIAAKDNYFAAKKPVQLYGYVLSNTEYKEKSNLWKLTDHKTRQVDEVALPTLIANQGNTTIISLSDIIAQNVAIMTAGHVEMAAKNITISAPVLNHTRTEEDRNFGYQVPITKLNNAYPMYDDYQALKNSHCGAEWVANSWNMAFDSFNSLNSLVSGFRTGSLGQALFPASYLTSVDVNYTHTKTVTNWQTIPNNVGIQCGSMTLKAEDLVAFTNGVPIYVAGDASIYAKVFRQTGAELNSSISSTSQSISVGASLQGNLNVGANLSGSLTRAKSYANQVLQVGGVLSVNVTDWEMTNANVFANKLNADVAHLSIVSQANTSSTHAWSVGVNTNGNLSYQNYHNRSAQVGLASGIAVGAGGIDMNVKKLYLEGGKVVSAANSHIYAEVVESKSVDEYNRGSSYGFNGNIHDVMKVQPIPQWQQGIPSVGVSLGNQNYKASQLGTISVPNSDGLRFGQVIGNLNTTNDNGLVVERDAHYNVQVKVPVFNAQGLKQVEDNINWARNKLFQIKTILPATDSTIESKVDLNKWKAKKSKDWSNITSSDVQNSDDTYYVSIDPVTELTTEANKLDYANEILKDLSIAVITAACAEAGIALGGAFLLAMSQDGAMALEVAEVLTKGKIINYLSKITELDEEQIIADLDKLGLKLKGKKTDIFKEFKDKNDKVRVKIHPPDRKTRYDHIHIYTKYNEPLDNSLNKVIKDSKEAHIPIHPRDYSKLIRR